MRISLTLQDIRVLGDRLAVTERDRDSFMWELRVGQDEGRIFDPSRNGLVSAAVLVC